MKEVLKLSGIIILLGGITFAFFSRVFAVGGANPDLPLLFFAWLAVLPGRRRPRFAAFALFAALFLLFSFMIAPFWWGETIIFAVVIFAAFFLDRFLTGNWFYDFLIVQVAGSFVFYALSSLFFKIPFALDYIFPEVVYDLILSLFFFPLLRKLAKMRIQ